MKQKASTDQLRWVAVLLATAVILPTVCLLWFMTQAVKNERLAVRQRLQTWYREQWRSIIDDDYIQIVLSRDAASGLLVFDSTGKQSFPVAAADDDSDKAVFRKAFALEFEEQDISKALDEYQRIRRSASEPAVRIQADLSTARCLARLDQPDKAINRLEQFLAEYDDSSFALRCWKTRAHLLLLEWMHQTKDDRFETTLSTLYDYVTQGIRPADNGYIGEPDFLDHTISSELQVYALSRYLDYSESLAPEPTRSKTVKEAKRLIDWLSLSVAAAEDYKTPDFLNDEGVKGSSTLFTLDAEKQLYGRYHRFREHTKVLFFTQESMSYWLNAYVDKFQKFPSVCRIYDAQGRLTAGPAPDHDQEPFITMPLSGWLPGWMVHLYVHDVTFDNAARKQAAVYLWTGVLVVALFLACGALTARIIGRQMRLNRLKNDFIATVTHELKTPLSSMRLLVETLLDGGYTDPKQCREYLELVCRENHRLSRMIDSFLTFSRMERGKQVFEMQKVDPAGIVQAAAEAVQPKFQEKKCRFSVTADAPLPSIMVDKDAMVTVLVNLLDNACKYSGDDKEIALRIFEQNGVVCFSVTDKGIGMTRRQIRRIFDKFYQADTSLARRAEGCGLGLSIVKYILDAHKAEITVDSKLGKGSVFTVQIPKS